MSEVIAVGKTPIARTDRNRSTVRALSLGASNRAAFAIEVDALRDSLMEVAPAANLAMVVRLPVWVFINRPPATPPILSVALTPLGVAHSVNVLDDAVLAQRGAQRGFLERTIR